MITVAIASEIASNVENDLGYLYSYTGLYDAHIFMVNMCKALDMITSEFTNSPLESTFKRYVDMRDRLADELDYRQNSL